MIASLLDTDLYKLTMQKAVRTLYPELQVEYAFHDRSGRSGYTRRFEESLREKLALLPGMRFSSEELDWLESLPYFGSAEREALAGYRFEPAEVDFSVDRGCLDLRIRGLWQRTIFWETPLLALITETWYEEVDRAWENDLGAVYQTALDKARHLLEGNCAFVDFGTRRRRSFATHDAVIRALRDAGTGESPAGLSRGCTGTSNLHFARLYGLQPSGTVAHEWIMAHGLLAGVAEANPASLRAWLKVFPGEQTIALTDTYTLDLFLRGFDHELTETCGGVRHDSGNPETFIRKMLAHYKKHGVDPTTRKFVFSDGLDVNKATAIRGMLPEAIPAAFGIGTYLTNDIPASPPLDIVIKLDRVNGTPVAKTTEDPSKATGDRQAVRQALDTISALTAHSNQRPQP